MKQLITLLLVLISLIGYSQTKPTDIIKEGDIDTLFIEQLIFQHINDYRKSRKRSELKWDEEVAEGSRNHSKWMTDNDVFMHDTVGGHFFNECIMATVILTDFQTYEDLAGRIEVWKNSPGHNAALLSDRGNDYLGGIGISIMKDNIVVFTYRISSTTAYWRINRK